VILGMPVLTKRLAALTLEVDRGGIEEHDIERAIVNRSRRWKTIPGNAVETAFFKHVYTRYYRRSIGSSYWRGRKGHGVDVIADVGGRLTPFDVKYRAKDTGEGSLKDLVEFCELRNVTWSGRMS